MGKKQLKKINSDSWIDPRVEIRPSPIHRKGMFAKKLIKQGEKVIIWGGTIYSEAEVKSGKASVDNMANIDWDLYLADPIDAPELADKFTNHSCDPNLWMKDEITLIASKDIEPGEEITIDYATFSAGIICERFQCRCDSSLCRGEVTETDWCLPELQARYRNHFSPYINERIRQNSVQHEII